MNHYLDEANKLYKELVNHRRLLHSIAEVGLDLPYTTDYVENVLASFGYKVYRVEGGLTCSVGNGNRTVLLRADMDALPQLENSGLSFASKNGSCHSCGHDIHMTMLLGAAKLLKQREHMLPGCIKFMFQAGEEGFNGAEYMVKSGILRDPPVDIAIALHVIAGENTYDVSTGILSCFENTALQSADTFRIVISGKASHGAMPDYGVSAISSGVAIINALNHITSMELPTTGGAVLSVCKFYSGTAANIIPDEAVLEGTFRTYRHEDREFIKKRISEICQHVCDAYRAEVKVNYIGEIGPLVNDIELSNALITIASDIIGSKNTRIIKPDFGSDDFAFISEKVPSFYAMLGAGSVDQGYSYGLHDPRVIFDESVIPIGVALLLGWTTEWLEKNS